MKKILLSLALGLAGIAHAQSVGIGTNNPNPSAALEVSSANKGMLIPRVLLGQPDDNTSPINNPATGLLVYHTGSITAPFLPAGFYFWNGASWSILLKGSDLTSSLGSTWRTFGNAPTQGNEFIGTTNFQSLRFRMNNSPSGLIDSLFGRTTFGFATGTPNFGPNNSAFGFRALSANPIQSSSNTAVGSLSLRLLTTGFSNTAVGGNSMANFVEGDRNTGIGGSALGSLVSGSANTGIGQFAGAFANMGDSNTAVGFMATPQNGANVSRSTAIGALAMVSRSDAIVLGSVSGQNNATKGVVVGIGTTNPQRKLHIVDEIASGLTPNGNAVLVLEKNNVASYLNFLNNGAESGILFGVAGTPASAANGGIVYHNALNRQGLQFRTGGNQNRMVIDSVGRVGLGTTNPQYRFHVSTNDTQNLGFLQGIMVENTATGVSGGGMSNTGEAAISFKNAGPDGTGDRQWMVGLNQNRNLSFGYGTEFNGPATKVVIDSTGNMGIGITSPTQKLHVNGSILATGTITPSDTRFKKNIIPLASLLVQVMALKPMEYEWKKEDFPQYSFGDEKSIGVMAQELEKYFPTLVVTDSKGYKAVDYSKLSVVLLKAMQEQQDLIVKQQSTLQDVLKRLATLEADSKNGVQQ